MMLIEETAPAAEALPVAALRAHLRLGSGFEIADDNAENAALTGYLRAAIAAIEARTGKVLLTRRFRMQLDDWRDRLGQALPLAPVLALDVRGFPDFPICARNALSFFPAAGPSPSLSAAISAIDRPVETLVSSR